MKSIFPLPKMREFHENYQDLCEQRAIDLLQLAADLNVGIYVFWSGGVDSTCALISLLKHGQSERLTILLNENSVLEYPLFYSRFIRGKLRCQSVNRITEVFNERALVVNGEGNDQLFGSDIIEDAISLFGIEAVLGRLQRELMTSLFQHKGATREIALFFSGLFGRLLETAPVPLRTNFALLWWINFAIKWQTVYMRSLIFSKKPLSAEHVKTYYRPFYNTTDFQLWSMNNLDKRIKNHWRTYKWPCKEIIYEFTGDENYRDSKIKHGSLQYVFIPLAFHNFLDEHFNFCEKIDWYEPQNDFTPATFDPLSRSLCEDAQLQQLLRDSRLSKPDGDILLGYGQRALY